MSTGPKNATVEVMVGTVGRPHGIRGEVTVNATTDEPERRFVAGGTLRVGSVERTIAAVRPQGDGIRLAFEGVTDRTSAEALRGDEMWAEVPADESPAGDGEYWDRQLVGLRVLNHAGAEVGRVASVGHLPAQDHLVIATPEGERRVPFVEALVPEVDLEAGFVRLADVPGLIDEAEQA